MKAVYYICNNKNWGHVAAKVWELLEKEGYFKEKTGILFDGMPVYKYIDEKLTSTILYRQIPHFVWTIINICRI